MSALCKLNFSIYADASTSFGYACGDIELASIPRIGEMISFFSPKNGVAPISISGFLYHLQVESVSYNANSPMAATSVGLQTVVLTSVSDAKILFAYLEDGFGLLCFEF